MPRDLLYGKKTTPIPTPEFFVIYNGRDEYPDRKVLRLSDAFIVSKHTPSLELEVPVYNVSKGHNSELLSQSTALSDYAVFITYIKDRINQGDDLETAIDNAIHYCIEHGIMQAYLEQCSDEVKRMLTLEWNDEIYREVLLKEGREEGAAEGKAEAINNTARIMRDAGEPIEKITLYTGCSAEEIAKL